MAIRIIEEKPDPSVVKRVSCKNCGVGLEYLPVDVTEHHVTDYTGSSDTLRFIICPKCNEHIYVR